MTRSQCFRWAFLALFWTAAFLESAQAAEAPSETTTSGLTPYDDSISGNYYWMSAGVGIDNLASLRPFSLGDAEFSMMLNDHFFSIRGVAAGTKSLLLRPRDTATVARSIDLLYGRGAHAEMDSGPFSSGILSLSAGISWVRIENLDAPKNARFKNTIGFPIQMENIYQPWSALPVGVGLTASFNINAVKPFGGVALNLVVGKLD